MRICFITDAWTPVWGGGQEHIWQIAQRLVKNHDCEVDILTPNIASIEGKTYPAIEKFINGKLRLERIGPVFEFPALWGRVANLIWLFWWLLFTDYDIYHSHSNAAVFLPLIKLFRPDRKYVYTVHGAGVEIVGATILNRIGFSKIPIIIWKYLVYHYPWDGMLSAAKSTITNKVSAKNFLVIGNGVDISAFDKVKSPGKHQGFRVVWIGRINDPVKGLIYFQQALARINTKHTGIEPVIVTNKPHDEVVRILKSGDLYVLTSLSEGLPVSLLEAMAAKVPVVVTDVGDCRQIVEEAGCGYVVPPGDSDAIAKAVSKIILERNGPAMGVKGYTLVKNNYNWDIVARKQYAFFQKIIDR